MSLLTRIKKFTVIHSCYVMYGNFYGIPLSTMDTIFLITINVLYAVPYEAKKGGGGGGGGS